MSKQLDGIGNVLSKQLVNAGKTDFDTILMSNPRDIELVSRIEYLKKCSMCSKSR